MEYYIPDCDQPLLLVNRYSQNLIFHGASVFHDGLKLPISKRNVFSYNYSHLLEQVSKNHDYDSYTLDNPSNDYLFIHVPCGHCPRCRTRKQLDLINRSILETATWQVPPYFFTLTYDNDNLPNDGNLCYYDIQSFFKRWRIYLDRQHITHNIRYLVSGEYGSKYGRPHYHLIIWNNPYGADELQPLLHRKLADDVFHIWNKCQLTGFDFGQCKGGAASYVTKYITKQSHSSKMVKPFVHASSRPYGLGGIYLHEHLNDIRSSAPSRKFIVNSAGDIREIPFSSYIQRHIFPSPTQLVPYKIRNIYKQLTDLLSTLVALRSWSYEAAYDILEIIRPYKTVLCNRLVPPSPMHTCPTFSRLLTHRYEVLIDNLLYELSEVVDIDNNYIKEYQIFKDSQPAFNSNDSCLRRFRDALRLGAQTSRETF